MHTELTIYVDLRHRERQRDEHVEQGRRLRALIENERSAKGRLTRAWHAISGLLRWRWSWSGLPRREDAEIAAEAAWCWLRQPAGASPIG